MDNEATIKRRLLRVGNELTDTSIKGIVTITAGHLIKIDEAFQKLSKSGTYPSRVGRSRSLAS